MQAGPSARSRPGTPDHPADSGEFAGSGIAGSGGLAGSDVGAIAWMLCVAVAYGFATAIRMAQAGHFGPDHMMILAKDILAQGRFDLTSINTVNDVVTLDGHYYQAMSPLPVAPYFVFVPFEFLWPYSRWIVSAGLGIAAAWVSLPLARRYGPGGPADWWLATLGAFGTMLFTLSIEGDFYYLAHLESVLLISLALIEWRGAGRPAVLGLLIGLAGLARPTLWIVVVPFGLVLLWEARAARAARAPVRRVTSVALALALPMAGAVLITGLFDFVRFGSPLETGYSISDLADPQLAELREQGLFSLSHVPANLGLFLFGGVDHVRAAFPWIVPSVQGQSIFLTTPAVLLALAVNLRDRTNLVLWASAILVAIPVFLYYGGGGASTYGYRYAMDFMPFLLALVAAACRVGFSWFEKALIALSVLFCSYGVVWAVAK